ncbi:hypothetical protein [Deinococcus knuensis]|uniref:Uncharacterized protein n=1 Tax=Deinococcus knuensis TaxID=1837380 RepID=A0ABQ2SZ98_9DEIO|nr:hypothetical protein [Deinococcus knuensis]GGS44888.1 hypothetical protein GCM10008961_39410 [Deinococcus knuensis]
MPLHGCHFTERGDLPLDVGSLLFEARLLLAVQGSGPEHWSGGVSLRGLWAGAVLLEGLPLDGEGLRGHWHVHLFWRPLWKRGLASGLLDPFGHDGQPTAQVDGRSAQMSMSWCISASGTP